MTEHASLHHEPTVCFNLCSSLGIRFNVNYPALTNCLGYSYYILRDFFVSIGCNGSNILKVLISINLLLLLL